MNTHDLLALCREHEEAAAFLWNVNNHPIWNSQNLAQQSWARAYRTDYGLHLRRLEIRILGG